MERLVFSFNVDQTSATSSIQESSIEKPRNALLLSSSNTLPLLSKVWMLYGEAA